MVLPLSERGIIYLIKVLFESWESVHRLFCAKVEMGAHQIGRMYEVVSSDNSTFASGLSPPCGLT